MSTACSNQTVNCFMSCLEILLSTFKIWIPVQLNHCLRKRKLFFKKDFGEVCRSKWFTKRKGDDVYWYEFT